MPLQPLAEYELLAALAHESVSFRREVVCEGRALCRGCAGERYYEPA